MDARLLEKVEKLLAKAQATDFADEAAALTARAQGMMLKYSIDEAMLNLQRGVQGSSVPTSVQVTIGKPRMHNGATFARLMGVIGSVNNVQVIQSGGPHNLWLVGFESDIEATRMLYASLVVQATSAELKARAERSNAAWVASSTFKAAFLQGYVTEVGSRLRLAAKAAAKEATVEYGGKAEVALVDRKAAVQAKVREQFPRLGTARGRYYGDRMGQAAGRAAGARADIGGKKVGAGRKALTG